MPPRYFRAAGLALVVALAALQITSAFEESATWDEPVHFAAGFTYLSTGSFEMSLEHPPLARVLMALPAWLIQKPRSIPTDWDRRQSELTANLFLYRNTVSPEALLLGARLMNIALTAAFALFLAWWTRRRFGPAVALFTLALFAFDPNITAHGRYVTTDLAAAFTIFAATALWIEYLLSRRTRWLVLTGVAVGAACASKLSTLYLPPLLLALFWLRPAPFRRRVIEFAKCAATLTGLVAVVLCLAYWPEVRSTAQLPALSTKIMRMGPTGGLIAFLADRLHFPAYSFLVGIDRMSEYASVGMPTYLLGEIRQGGFWYYFPVAFAVKTPMAVLGGIVAAVTVAVRHRNKLTSEWIPAVVAMIAAGAYALTAVAAGINIGIRHFLPVYPLLYVVMGWLVVKVGNHRRLAAAIVSILIVESAAVFPNYLTFFNQAAGGPRNGHRYLLDSNLDWGQAAKQLGDYMKERNIPQVCLLFFGNVDLPRVGVHNVRLAPGSDPEAIDCVAAISATPLHGLYIGQDAYASFRALTPDAIIGNSIYVYDRRKGRT